MASIRGKVHIDELPKFNNFLKEYGWTILKPKGVFEEVRAKKNNMILLGYKRMKSEHLTFSLEYMDIINQYSEYKKLSKLKDNK